MLRIDAKRFVALMLTALLVIAPLVPAFSAENSFRPDDEDLYFSALTEEITEEVKTTKVYRDDFVVSASCKGEIEYENISYVVNDIIAGKVEFVRYVVSNGSKVKNGDPIAEVKLVLESISTDELAAELAVTEENYEAFVDTNNALLLGYEKIMQKSPIASERRTAELLYNRLKITFEDEKEIREKEVEALRSKLEAYESLDEKQYIYATSTGTVSWISRYKSGETLKNNAFMCAIFDVDHVRIKANGASDQLRYNMPVTVIQTLDNESREMQGRVTTSHSALLSPGLAAQNDYVEVYGDPSNFAIGEDVLIKYSSVYMENAVVVDKNAVYHDNKGDYVYLFKDGLSSKRYIKKGGINSSVVWVISGLSDGDEVVVK